MAKFNEILTGRYNRFIQKLFSMKGPAPAPQLSSDIAMQMAFFNGVENRYLETWDRFSATLSQGATIGQVSAIRLRNPATSQAVVVIEKLLVENNTAVQWEAQVRHGAQTVDQAAIFGQTGLRLDPRGRPNASSILSQGIAVAGIEKLRAVMAVNSNFEFVLFEDQEIPVLPGEALDVDTSIANQVLTLSIMWRERALEDSERT